MPIRTFALLDLVGIKDAIASGRGAASLKRFWDESNSWTVHYEFPSVKRLNSDVQITPIFRVVTFSDSALISSEDDISVSNFYLIAIGYKQWIEDRVKMKSYMILSRNDVILPQSLPSVGCQSTSGDMKPLCINIAGSGKAWTDLWVADAFVVKKKKNWHSKFSVYFVGQDINELMVEPKDEDSIPHSEDKIFALK